MPSSNRKIALYGAGGLARELEWLVRACELASGTRELACFIDDAATGDGAQLVGYPVLPLEAARRRFPDARVVGAVGNPKTRERLVEKAAAAGFAFDTLIDARVPRSDRIEIGIGTVICAGSVLSTDIRLGAHVQVNLSCTIAHDVEMADYATLAPGAHVSGNVHLGTRAYIGTGAVVINGHPGNPLVIGDDAIVGAGACVTRSVPPGVTVIGVPARPIGRP